jgi:hypothetical protein
VSSAPSIRPQRSQHPNIRASEARQIGPSKEPIITHSMIGFSALGRMRLMGLRGRMLFGMALNSFEMAANIAIKPFSKKASQWRPIPRD